MNSKVYKNLYFRLSIILIALAFSPNLYSQIYSLDKGWLAGIHGGAVSFYGDLSLHDWNPGKKLSEESKLGNGLFIGKQINRVFTLKAKYLNGSMKGSNSALGYSFKSDFKEYSIVSETSLLDLITQKNDSRFKYLLLLGGGFMNAKPVRYTSFNDTKEVAPELKETVLTAGLGVDYKLSRSLFLGVQADLHSTWSDKLDVYEGTATMKDDYYSYLSLNITYIFNPTGRSFAEAMPCSPW